MISLRATRTRRRITIDDRPSPPPGTLKTHRISNWSSTPIAPWETIYEQSTQINLSQLALASFPLTRSSGRTRLRTRSLHSSNLSLKSSNPSIQISNTWRPRPNTTKVRWWKLTLTYFSRSPSSNPVAKSRRSSLIRPSQEVPKPTIIITRSKRL